MPETSGAAIDPEEFRRLGHRAVDLAADYLEHLPRGKVFRPMTAEERAAILNLPLPEEGIRAADILERVADAVLTHPMGNGHPRFFGWVNSAPAPIGALADFLAATMNPSCAGGDHAGVYVERCAVRWLMELVGFPTGGSMGLLVSGGSMASLTCLAAARHHAARRDGWNVRDEGMGERAGNLVLYGSEEVHSCIQKAAELLGFGRGRFRVLPTRSDFRLDVDALREAVKEDRARGRRPVCVAASAGTVNTGAVDPLAELADFCADEGLWLHVDGAYGAVGILDAGLADRYDGLDRVDSLALDPHKWLCVPVECGCALVRDGALLRETFSLVPPYLRSEEGRGFGGLPWYSEYGMQQTRGFRALKLWMTLQQLGRAGVRALVSRHNALARRLAAAVDASPELERLAPVTLSVVCFRHVPSALAGDERGLDLLNRRLVETLQSEGRAFVSGTELKGRFALRACVLHHETTERDIDALVETVLETGARVAREI